MAGLRQGATVARKQCWAPWKGRPRTCVPLCSMPRHASRLPSMFIQPPARLPRSDDMACASNNYAAGAFGLAFPFQPNTYCEHGIGERTKFFARTGRGWLGCSARGSRAEQAQRLAAAHPHAAHPTPALSSPRACRLVCGVAVRPAVSGTAANENHEKCGCSRPPEEGSAACTRKEGGAALRAAGWLGAGCAAPASTRVQTLRVYLFFHRQTDSKLPHSPHPPHIRRSRASSLNLCPSPCTRVLWSPQAFVFGTLTYNLCNASPAFCSRHSALWLL